MIVDTHCHIHDRAFADIAEAVRVAASHAVWGAVAVGCDPETNTRTLDAAAAWPKAIWPCLGFHPEWLHLTDDADKPVTLVGVKTVNSGRPWLIWRETTTLHTRLLRGHTRPEEDDQAETIASGEVRLSVPDFLRELTTFRVTGPSSQARARGLAQFGTLFAGKLWDVYARPILSPSPF